MAAINANGDLERYLLGMLPDEERARIDERLLIDNEVFEALCVVENELAYDYALGLLTPDERRRFEERFLDRPAMQARVRTAAALIDEVRAAGGAARTHPRWWLYVAAAAGLVLAAWLVRDEVRLRQAQSPQSQQAATPTAPAAAAPAPQVTPDRAAPMIAVTLQPGIVRSSTPPSRVRLRAADVLRVELTLPTSVASAASYRASIRNPDDLEVWKGDAVASQSGGVVVLTVPAGSLAPNDYEVTLFAIRPGGSSRELASYALSISAP